MNTLSTQNKTVDIGGFKANLSGKNLEHQVQEIFEQNNFKIYSYNEWNKLEKKPLYCLIKNFPYTSIYGTKGRTEFVAYVNNIPVRIECKVQHSAGSVDEKLPYLYMNAIHSFPERHVIIIIEGLGFKKGAITWLTNACSQSDKKIDVVSLEEFVDYLEKINLKQK